MAVPKKRTSPPRRDKRRATHRAPKPRLNECPRCHSPRLPHRVCPVCGTYAGREVITHEIGDGDRSAAADGISVRVFGDPAQLSELAGEAAVELVEAPGEITNDEDPVG